jgi:heptosyltransferase-2
MKVLVIRFSSIGDILLSSPVIRCLKKQLPDTELHFLCEDRYRSLVEHNPALSRLHVLAHSRELMLEELISENYDAVIDLQHNTLSGWLVKELGKTQYRVHNRSLQKKIYTRFKVNLLGNRHRVDDYFDTVKPLGVTNDGDGLELFISPKEETKREDIPASHYAGYIAAIIGGSHFSKRWPVSKWKTFCAKMDHPIILLGGKEDAAAGREIAEADTVKIYNACGKFSLNESGDLLRKARLVIGQDTGLVQMAAALKRPVITLWGSSTPGLGEAPYYGEVPVPSTHLQVEKLWCRPCSATGRAQCPLGHFKCMQKLEADTVLNAVKRRL